MRRHRCLVAFPRLCTCVSRLNSRKTGGWSLRCLVSWEPMVWSRLVPSGEYEDFYNERRRCSRSRDRQCSVADLPVLIPTDRFLVRCWWSDPNLFCESIPRPTGNTHPPTRRRCAPVRQPGMSAKCFHSASNPVPGRVKPKTKRMNPIGASPHAAVDRTVEGEKQRYAGDASRTLFQPQGPSCWGGRFRRRQLFLSVAVTRLVEFLDPCFQRYSARSGSVSGIAGRGLPRRRRLNRLATRVHDGGVSRLAKSSFVYLSQRFMNRAFQEDRQPESRRKGQAIDGYAHVRCPDLYGVRHGLMRGEVRDGHSWSGVNPTRFFHCTVRHRRQAASEVPRVQIQIRHVGRRLGSKLET